jgi:DNA-binding transcriptional ArsR family regulator
MAVRRRHLTSADDLRALAHPVRLDLMELLASSGPQTATEAAAALDQTPANVSWHLRKLGEHGLVQQDSSGPGRRRPWRLVAQAHSWGEDSEDPTAVAALRDMVVEREIAVLRDALARHDSEPEEWRQATIINQYHLWLTADEARELSRKCFELMSRFAPRGDDPSRRPPGSRLMAAMEWVVPFRAEGGEPE